MLIGSVLLFHETIRRQDVWFILVSLTGLAIILAGQVGQASVAGLTYGVLAGVFYAAVILSLRSLRQFDSAWLVFLNQVATALVFLPVCITGGVRPEGAQWIYLGGFGMLQLGLPYLLFARGLRRIRSHEASLVVLLEPILVPVWVFLVWRDSAGYEPPRLTTLVGGSVILASLVIRYGAALLRSRRRASRGNQGLC